MSKTDSIEAEVRIVSDEDLLGLPVEKAKALYALNEAEGAGDYEMLRVPKGDSGVGYVDGYDVNIPEWTPKFLKAVQVAVDSVPPREAVRLTAGLSASMDCQAAEAGRRFVRLRERLAELTNVELKKHTPPPTGSRK